MSTTGSRSRHTGSLRLKIRRNLGRCWPRWRLRWPKKSVGGKRAKAASKPSRYLDQTGRARLPEALSLLADLDARRGRLADAEGLRLSIWHLWERLAGSDSAVLAREYERRAELLRSMERPTEAGYLLGKAERIRRAVASA